MRLITATLTKLLSFSLFLFSLSAFGQDRTPAKFGKISAADLKIKSYNIDQDASAVVIADVGSSQIVGNLQGWFSVEFRHYKRIHILKKAAFDLANVEILLYKSDNSEEEVKELKAHTYNLENGKVVETKVDVKKLVYGSVVDKNHFVKKFVLPAVREGSIIEFEYTVNSGFIFNLQPWRFQGNYPVLWSEYNVSIPEFLYYIFLQQGDFKKTQSSRTENFRVSDFATAGKSSVESFVSTINEYRMLMQNVPVVKEENYISSIENHVAKVEFQLAEYRSPLPPRVIIGDWEDVARSLLEDESFGGVFKKDNSWLDDEVKRILANATTDEEKARNIYRYIQKNITCIDHDCLYADQSLKSVFRNKKGNEAEINLLLTEMLRRAGLAADPLLLSKKSHGYVFSNYPVIDRFNYVVCRVIIGDRPIYLDASRVNLGFGKLDWECYNGHARVINDSATVVELSSDSLIESKVTTLMLYTDQKGEIIGTVQQTPGYYESLSIRDKIKVEGLGAVLKDLENDKPEDLEIKNYRITDIENLDDQLQMSYDIKLNVEKKDVIYIDPMFGERFMENPFPEEKRIYPIEMPYTLDETYIARIELPAGYKIVDVPKSTKINLDEEGKSFFSYIVEELNGVISLRSRVKIHRSYFLPEEYKSLHDFFAIVVSKQNEKIVLKKIK